jgi:hypothetical protein
LLIAERLVLDVAAICRFASGHDASESLKKKLRKFQQDHLIAKAANTIPKMASNRCHQITVLSLIVRFANETFPAAIGGSPSTGDFAGVPERASCARPTDGMWLLGRNGCRHVLPMN